MASFLEGIGADVADDLPFVLDWQGAFKLD
jgi:hypothetical protein